MARSKTLYASVDRTCHTESGARAEFQILIEGLNRQAHEGHVDLILWDTLELGSEIVEVDTRTLAGPPQSESWITWTATVTGVIQDD